MHKSLYFKDDTDRLHAKMQEERNGFIHIENYISSISKRLKDYTKQSDYDNQKLQYDRLGGKL